VFHRFADTEQAEIAQLLEQLMGGEGRVLFPLVHVRVDFFLDKVTDRTAQFFVFLRKQHDDSPEAQRRATPKVLVLSGRRCASRQMSRTKATTLRVSRGSMMPSSHMWAVP